MPKWYLFFNISGLSCNMMKTLNLYSYIYHSAKPIPVLSVFHCRLQRFASCVRHKHSAHSIASSFPLFYIHISGASSQTTCRISAFSTTQKSWMNEDVLVFVMLHGRQLWLLLFLLYIMEWVCFVSGAKPKTSCCGSLNVRVCCSTIITISRFTSLRFYICVNKLHHPQPFFYIRLLPLTTCWLWLFEWV